MNLAYRDGAAAVRRGDLAARTVSRRAVVSGEWVDWHRQYENGGRGLARRLEAVQGFIRAMLDGAPPGPIRAISLCAGDGRDLLGALAGHPRAEDVRARLVDATPELVDAGRRAALRQGLPAIEFVLADAGITDPFEDAAPADLVLACGIFGNVTNDDIRNTIRHLPELCARDATVVWTRGRFAPDLTPTIRGWFLETGFVELGFIAIPDTTAAVGANRLDTLPAPYRRGIRLFTFLPREERPSVRAQAAPP